MNEKLSTYSFDSVLGKIHLASTPRGLAIVSFGRGGKRRFQEYIRKHFPGRDTVAGGDMNKKAAAQITAYLDGRLRKFDLDFDLQGTPFRKRVLRRVGRIPYGRVMTYGEVAGAIGRAGAARAVGAANAGNLLPIVIPCHRVVAKNGPGGYGGGLAMKKYLLQLEKADLK